MPPPSETAPSLQCSLLLFVATGTERDCLRRAARDAGFSCSRRKGRFGTYYDLGDVGYETVLAVQTDMGPFGQRGSAARAIQYLAETGATALIAIGMAFGVKPADQQHGAVLVSTGVIPYDYRIIVDSAEGTPRADYSKTRHYPAREQLVTRFRHTAAAENWRDRVHFGLFLSGGARIYSSRYRDNLVRECGMDRDDVVVGGEMEGVGLLSSCAEDDPRWIIVKGISDFADQPSDSRPSRHRKEACYNAAQFVLAALADTEIPDA